MSLKPCYWLRVCCFGDCKRAYDVAAIDVATLQELTRRCPVCHGDIIERPVAAFGGKTVRELPYISRGVAVGVPIEMIESVEATIKRRKKGKRGRAMGDTKINQAERKEAACRAKAARAGSQSDSSE
jgi:hypothetical protein